MNNVNSKSLEFQQEMEKRKNGGSGNEVMLDPSTGELVAKKPNAPVPRNATVVSDIADDGFALL